MKHARFPAKRVGIIGFGKMGRTRAQALEEDGRATIARIHDPLPIAEPRYPVAASAQEIFDDPAIGSVFLCGTNDLLPVQAIAAMRAGKHVFSEKPPAFNAAQLNEVRAVERETGRVLMYGFNHRHHAGVRKMKDVIASGAYGRVLWMRGRYGKSVDENYLGTWRADVKRAGGGILLDQGIHLLDLFLYMGGAPFDEVHAFVSSHYWNIPGIEDNVFAILRNSDTGFPPQLLGPIGACRRFHAVQTRSRASKGSRPSGLPTSATYPRGTNRRSPPSPELRENRSPGSHAIRPCASCQ